jgi:hypothetical protein
MMRRAIALVFLLLPPCLYAQSGSPERPASDFTSKGLGLTGTLLKFAHEEHLPVAIEYVDRASIDQPIDVSLRNKTVRQALDSILRNGHGARSTQSLTYQLRLALEPECLENPTATAREDPRDGADSIRDTQAVCDFRYLASKLTPLFHTINTIVAIFLAKVRRAISGLIPLASKAA